jgi:hypothetical protein
LKGIIKHIRKFNKDKALEEIVSDDQEEPGHFMVAPVAYAASSPPTDYKLRNSFIFDSGATIYVCNDHSRFQDFESSVNKRLYAGDTIVSIEGFGSVEITLQGPNGPRKVLLTKVALVSSFHMSVASLKCFIQKNVHWNTEAEQLTYRGKMYCQVPQ